MREPLDLSSIALLVFCVALFFAPLFPALAGAVLAAALPVLAAVAAAARDPDIRHSPRAQ